MNPELLERDRRLDRVRSEFSRFSPAPAQSHTPPNGLGRLASTERIKENQISFDPAQIEEIVKTRYASEVLTTLAEHGNYEDSFNTLRDLMADMDIEDTGKGRRNQITNAVHTLSDNGLVLTKKAVSKGSNGKEHIIFSPLYKKGNFIILDLPAYEAFQSAKVPD